jgi:hypothetical protein
LATSRDVVFSPTTNALRPVQKIFPVAQRRFRILVDRNTDFSSTTWLTSGSSPELHLQGIPAPQVQPISLSLAISGWFSQTHPMP